MTDSSGLAMRQRAEELSATLPPLLVAAERVAATVSQGVHGRRRAGPGETFWQFRHYEYGDPASVIDWRRSARSDQLYVRQREWEAAQTIWLWRDSSASMRYRSPGATETKAERATLLLLAAMTLLLRSGEQVALLGRQGPPGRGNVALARLAREALERHEDESGLLPPQRLPRYGQVVLIGDFLSPLEEIDAAVKRLAAQGVSGHLVEILDPAEEMLPFSGRARFFGLEGNDNVLIGRVEAIRDEYRERLAAHRQGLASIARAADWSFVSHRTDRPPQTALLALYQALAADRRGAGA